MKFKAGEKIICVDASPSPHGRKLNLRRGRRYTVKAFDPYATGWIKPGKIGSTAGVQVKEIPMRTHWLRASRFKRV